MRKRKLYQLLILLSPEELQEFEQYLSLPLFNTSQTLLRYFHAWRDQVLRSDAEDVDAETLLDGTGIHPSRIDKLSSLLRKQVADFLALREFRKRDDLQRELFLEAMAHRDQPFAEVAWHYARIARKQEAAPESSDKHLQRMKLRRILALAMVRARETRAIGKEDFRDQHADLDQFYRLEKLKLASASANVMRIYNHEDAAATRADIEAVEAMDLGGADESDPLTRCYALNLRMMLHADVEAFDAQLEVLRQHDQQFSREDATELYAYALNFCIRQINSGRTDFGTRTSALYDQLLKSKLMLAKGYLPPQQFKNIVALHCRLGKLDWVRQFIDSHADSLPPEHQEQARFYNEGVLAFYLEDYPEAIRRFKLVIANLRDDIFYGLDARVHLWKAYFEHMGKLSIEEVDEMYKLYDAFRLFVERNDKISTAHKLDYRHFIKVFKRLIDIHQQPPLLAGDLHALRDEIEAMGPIANKRWLLEKVDVALQRSGSD